MRPGIHQIRVPLPFWSRYVNLYLVEADSGYILIDCGVSTEEAFATLGRYLQGIGCAFSDLTNILITHCHHDHYGMVGKIKRLSKATTAMHALETERANRLYTGTIAGSSGIAKLLLQNGLPSAMAAKAEEIVIAWRDVVSPAAIEEELFDGQEIYISPRLYRVLWAPGHSAGHVCFYEPARAILIAGDHLLATMIPHVGLTPYTGHNPLRAYMDSLYKVAQLEVELVLPGHGEPFSNHRKRAHQIAVHYSARTQQVGESLTDTPMTAYRIAQRAFAGDYSTFEGRLAFSETLAHLELLTSEGKAEKDTKGQTVLFRATGEH